MCNQLTKSIYPLKINEYLSAGKPVITTNFSEDILSFNTVIYDSETHDDFIENIHKAIAEDCEDLKNKRIEISRQNNWENRAAQVMKLVEEFTTTRDVTSKENLLRIRV